MSDGIHKENVLQYNNSPSLFVIKKAEELRMEIAAIPHRHSYYTILWSFNNAGNHTVDTHSFSFRPQTVWFIAPGQVHCIDPPQPKGVMLLFAPELFACRSVDDGLLSKLALFHSQGQPLLLSDENAARLMTHTVALSDAFFSSATFRMETIEAHLKLFLVACNDLWLLQQNQQGKESTRQHPAVTAFKKLVENHLHDWHKVDDYAGSLCLSPRYLAELIGKATGQSPKEYISGQLTIEAKRFALFSDLSVKEIGFRLGFDDPARFSRFFRQNTGLSFLEFRQTML
jgi:AraC family transcriptional regulator, transcriptional activator of pobA